MGITIFEHNFILGKKWTHILNQAIYNSVPVYASSKHNKNM